MALTIKDIAPSAQVNQRVVTMSGAKFASVSPIRIAALDKNVQALIVVNASTGICHELC